MPAVVPLPALETFVCWRSTLPYELRYQWYASLDWSPPHRTTNAPPTYKTCWRSPVWENLTTRFHNVSVTPPFTFRLPARVKVPLPQTVFEVIVQSPERDWEPKAFVLPGHPVFARTLPMGEDAELRRSIIAANTSRMELTRPRGVR